MRENGVMTNGKFEGLMHISNSQGQFTIVATDQRGSLKRMINPQQPDRVTPEQMKKVKMALIKNLVGKKSPGRASGVLVDPEYSYEREFLKSCDIRADVGVLMSIEASGYGGKGEFAPEVQIFGGLEVEEAVLKIKNRGAAAVKMLVYYRPDSPTSKYQESMVKAVGRACEKYDIAFLLEPVSHSLEGGPHKKRNPKEFSEIKQICKLKGYCNRDVVPDIGLASARQGYEECLHDVNGDGGVDGNDVGVFLSEFGRSTYFLPCPVCQ